MEQLERGGVRLCYEDVGRGFPPIMLLHDLACDHRSFSPQVEHFRESHRVVTVDLRGHGESGKPKQAYTLQEFAEDTAWLCYELGLHKPILVGHGLGGMTAIKLATEYPDIPSGIVVLEPMILPPLVTKVLREEFLKKLPQTGSRSTMHRFMGLFFPSVEVEENRKRIRKTVYRSPQHVTVSVWKNCWQWDLIDSIANCIVPLLYVGRGMLSPALTRIRDLSPLVMTALTTGTGHFPQLEVPEQVNTAIERMVVFAKSDMEVKL